MNILISVNESYLDKAEIMLLSVRKNTREKLDIYLLNHSLDEHHISRFCKFLARHNMSLHIVNVSNTNFDGMTLGNAHFSIEMYYRILAQYLLPKDLDRILWLDADIVALKDIKHFYNQSFDEKAMVVCPDSKYNSKLIVDIKNNLGLPKEYIYFNSGVLLLNLTYLRKNISLENIISLSKEIENKLIYPDQDILNYIYHNKIKYAEWQKYNFQLVEIGKVDKVVLDEVVIMHYSGPYKPWNYAHINSFSKYYWRVAVSRGRICSCVFAYTMSLIFKVILFTKKSVRLVWKRVNL